MSSLLAALGSTPGVIGGEAGELRREVEDSSPSMLPPLARRALALTDLACWALLEQGDMTGFRRCADASAALFEFTASAGLLR